MEQEWYCLTAQDPSTGIVHLVHFWTPDDAYDATHDEGRRPWFPFCAENDKATSPLPLAFQAEIDDPRYLAVDCIDCIRVFLETNSHGVNSDDGVQLD